MHAIRAKMVPYLRLETLTNHTLYTLLSYIGVATRVTYESWSQFRLYSVNYGWLLLTMFNSEFEGWNLLGRPQRYNLYPPFSQMYGFQSPLLSVIYL